MLSRFLVNLCMVAVLLCAPLHGSVVRADGLVRNPVVDTAVSSIDSAGTSGAVSILESEGSFGMMPWILGLLVAVALGVGALRTGAKKTKSGYTIIEEV